MGKPNNNCRPQISPFIGYIVPPLSTTTLSPQDDGLFIYPVSGVNFPTTTTTTTTSTTTTTLIPIVTSTTTTTTSTTTTTTTVTSTPIQTQLLPPNSITFTLQPQACGRPYFSERSPAINIIHNTSYIPYTTFPNDIFYVVEVGYYGGSDNNIPVWSSLLIEGYYQSEQLINICAIFPNNGAGWYKFRVKAKISSGIFLDSSYTYSDFIFINSLEPSTSIAPTTQTPDGTTTTTETPLPPVGQYITLAGIEQGSGRIASFNCTLSFSELESSNFVTLLQNVCRWLVKSKSNPRIGITSSSDVDHDSAIRNALISVGSVDTLNFFWYSNITQNDLLNTDLLIYTANYNWSATTDAPLQTQQAIVNFINNGGGLLTTEWVHWKRLTIIKDILPVAPVSSNFDNAPSVVFAKLNDDPIISNNVPNAFNVNLTNIGGTRSLFTTPKAGATIFYTST